jgi:SAM-dependent methyltransferase
MNPQYSDEYLADYYSHYTREEGEMDVPAESGYDFDLALIEKYVPGTGRLLDVGTGTGYLLTVALRRGWKVTGYEVDEGLSRRLSGKLDVEVLSGDFTKLDWPEGQIDAVAMHHVIEHLKDPLSYVRTIRRILREEGILFMALPNIGSISSRFKLILEKKGIKRKNVGACYDTGHHLFYFTPSTMKGLMTTTGFEVLYMRSGQHIDPRQPKLKQFIMRNFTERNLLHSTFACISRKKKMNR